MGYNHSGDMGRLSPSLHTYIYTYICAVKVDAFEDKQQLRTYRWVCALLMQVSTCSSFDVRGKQCELKEVALNDIALKTMLQGTWTSQDWQDNSTQLSPFDLCKKQLAFPTTVMLHFHHAIGFGHSAKHS